MRECDGFLERERPARIAVFRALVLGDMLVAIPALRALRRACPDAHVVLVGLESMRDLIGRYDDLVDELVAFPGHRDFPEQPVRDHAWPAFLETMHAKRLDLAIQLHGSGENANDIVRSFGARWNAGFRRVDQGPFDVDARDACFVPWDEHASELLRCLSLIEALGAPVDRPRDHAIGFPVTPRERAAWHVLRLQAGLDDASFVCVHPGARWPSRRWPVERFASVAHALARDGHRIVLTGALAEKPLVDRLAMLLAACGIDATDACGATTVGMLAAMLEDAALVVCNDTGISHVAAAVGAPSVVVASGSDVARWAPLDHARHLVIWRDVECRPCSYVECPIGHPCALRVPVDEVLGTARERLHATGSFHAG